MENTHSNNVSGYERYLAEQTFVEQQLTTSKLPTPASCNQIVITGLVFPRCGMACATSEMTKMTKKPAVEWIALYVHCNCTT